MVAGQRTNSQYLGDASDLASIRLTAMDYLQGWYEADAERMRRAILSMTTRNPGDVSER